MGEEGKRYEAAPAYYYYYYYYYYYPTLGLPATYSRQDKKRGMAARWRGMRAMRKHPKPFVRPHHPLLARRG